MARKLHRAPTRPHHPLRDFKFHSMTSVTHFETLDAASHGGKICLS